MGRLSRIIGIGFCAVSLLLPALADASMYVHALTVNGQGPPLGPGDFGRTIAPFGSNVLIGAPQYAEGRVALYDGATGAELTAFTRPSGGFITDSGFGTSLATIGGDVLIGDPFANRVYRFNATSGVLVQTYLAPEIGGSLSRFGVSVAVLGSNLVVGNHGQSTGRAYLIDGATGATLLTIANPDAGTFFFGATVATTGTDIIVGGNGRVHLFNGTTGAFIRDYPDPSGPTSPFSSFGWPLSVADGQLLVGGAGGPAVTGYLFNIATGALLQTFSVPNGIEAVAHLGGARVALGDRVFDATTGLLLQTLPPTVEGLAGGGDALYVGESDTTPFYNAPSSRVEFFTLEELGCLAANPECQPGTDLCCNTNTCRYDTCDPTADPCCSALTCNFAACNPAVDPCCDPGTCNYKATNATCVLTSGTNAGCRTGQCNASHTCAAVSSTNLDNGTACIPQVNPCFAGQCNNGVCQPPDGTGQPWADRCEDANTCTNDALACVSNPVTGAFIRCAFKDPNIEVADGTSCSTTSGAICTIKECQAGECQAVDPPQTIDCSALPPVSTCKFNTCQINASTHMPECVANQPMPAGSVCEVSAGSNDWDCRHYRCNNKSRCTGKRATEGKVCDFAPSTSPTAHCQLGTCNPKAQCVNPLFSSLAVVENMETAALDSDGTPVTQNLATCPSDNNACTVDRCSGSADSCINPCNAGAGCSVPGVCSGVCQIIGGTCQCGQAP